MHTTDTQEVSGHVPTSWPMLRVLYSGADGVVDRPAHALPRGALLLGRSVEEQGGLSLSADSRCSRHHATIHYDHATGGITVSDAGSKNGTFLNGGRMAAAEVSDGDLLRIGDSFLLLRYEPARRVDAAIPDIVGSAPVIRALRAALKLAGPSPATVLLLGESGSGKEVAARALHERSGRSGPFIAVNCGAIPESLAESQLFGHASGAFTGARVAQPGYFRAAHGGTLFLDELGELSPVLQPKLLRALEERAVVPVGAVTPVPCDVRLCAATNRDLVEDILALFLCGLCRPGARLTPRLCESLLLHAWPYNVREIFKVATHLRVCTPDTEVLDLDPVADRLVTRPSPVPPSAPAAPEAARAEPRPPTREELIALLRQHEGNISHVARAAGRSRRQVDRWLLQYELGSKDFRSGT
jgi:transcriptional regulator with PAS, ATPase and Fis domain